MIEAQRMPAADYPESRFPDTASAIVEEERRVQFQEEGVHYVSSYYMALLWLPPEDKSAAGENWLYEGRNKLGGADWREYLKTFTGTCQQLMGLVETFMPEASWLNDAETLTFLHSTISSNTQEVSVPKAPIYLDALLADQPLTGGLEPMLGDQHLRTLSTVGFSGTTPPGLLDDLNQLAFPYRCSSRAICLDKVDAVKLLSKIRHQCVATPIQHHTAPSCPRHAAANL